MFSRSSNIAIAANDDDAAVECYSKDASSGKLAVMSGECKLPDNLTNRPGAQCIIPNPSYTACVEFLTFPKILNVVNYDTTYERFDTTCLTITTDGENWQDIHLTPGYYSSITQIQEEITEKTRDLWNKEHYPGIIFNDYGIDIILELDGSKLKEPGQIGVKLTKSNFGKLLGVTEELILINRLGVYMMPSNNIDLFGKYISLYVNIDNIDQNHAQSIASNTHSTCTVYLPQAYDKDSYVFPVNIPKQVTCMSMDSNNPYYTYIHFTLTGKVGGMQLPIPITDGSVYIRLHIQKH